MQTTEPTTRQSRWKASLETAGVRQVNILAPEQAHPALREIASRTRAGEPLHKVLRSLAMRATNEDVRWGPLTVPAELVPGPAEVAIAVRGGKMSNGYTRKLISKAGLVRRDDIGAWCGIVSRDIADRLSSQAKGTTTTVVRSDSGAGRG